MSQINKPTDYFNTVLYTGDGTTSQSITGVGFEPEFLWIKRRDSSANHRLTDVVRGVSNKLESSTTGAEAGSGIGSFDSDGWTFNATGAGFNASSATYVGWNWLAGGTASSNTDGSITSSVSANTTSGFSIVSYTGTGANATVGHGLGSAPKMVIFKNRDNGTQEWDTYHAGLTDATYFIQLNSTNAQNNTNGALRFNSTAPTSSVFSVGTSTTTNESSSAMIAYCFTEKKGYSKFSSYTGNGSSDGTFVYTGFKPAFVMIKDITSTDPWHMIDNKRSPINLMNARLFPNNSNAENTSADICDFVSNGIKFRGTNDGFNGSRTYIYMCFAENPLVGTNNIPATAR